MQSYPFQRRVAECLLTQQQNVILQAPTGAGKTRAALLPWLQAMYLHEPTTFPWRCLYSVPMRVLAQQFVRAYESNMEKFAREHGRKEMRAAIQTGEQPDDPRLHEALVFATLDQTLSGALGIPYSLSKSLANLNAGAVMSSYLVWDEFHLFGREQALPTTLHLIQMLRGVAPFCLMTATFSWTLLAGLAEMVGAVVITVPAEERAAIPSQQGKQRRFRTVAAPLTAGAVWEEFSEQGRRRAIVICNTVERAQACCRALRALSDGQVDVRLLHSRFYQAHRQATTGWLEQEFAEGWHANPSATERAILVTTQVVEVGLDITCEVLHTELAPANALIQRAGRCARFAQEHGEVLIYDLPRDDGGQRQTAPYDREGATDLCARSWAALAAPERDGAVLDYDAELAILEEVHGEDDQAMLEEVRRGAPTHRAKMRQAMVHHDFSRGRELIRDIDNRSVVLHPNPNEDEVLTRSPWGREAFSLSRGTFFRLALGNKEPRPDAPRPWLGYEEEELDWALRYPLLVEGGAGDEKTSGPPRFTWERVDKQADLLGRGLFVVHPSLVTYDSILGLQLHPSGSAEHVGEPRPRRHEARSLYAYQLESYEAHIAGLWAAWRGGFYDEQAGLHRPALLTEVAYSLPRLAARAGVAPAVLVGLLRLILAGHDVGKLGRGWQTWVRRWQTEQVQGPYDPTLAYAHTDSDGSEAHKALAKHLGPRPTHAAESAAALLDVLWGGADENEALWRGAVTAIARHHGALHSGKLQQAWEADPILARRALRAALAVVGLDDALADGVSWREQLGKGVSECLVETGLDQEVAILCYLWFSRLLRLADQRSQQK